MSSRTYTCNKSDCWFCYEMNRPKIRPYRKEAWTDSDLNYLETNYKVVKTEIISMYLNRSPTSIWQKIHEMKTKKTLKSA